MISYFTVSQPLSLLDCDDDRVWSFYPALNLLQPCLKYPSDTISTGPRHARQASCFFSAALIRCKLAHCDSNPLNTMEPKGAILKAFEVTTKVFLWFLVCRFLLLLRFFQAPLSRSCRRRGWSCCFCRRSSASCKCFVIAFPVKQCSSSTSRWDGWWRTEW